MNVLNSSSSAPLHRVAAILLILCGMVLCHSCQDADDVLPSGRLLELSQTELSVLPKEQYRTIRVITLYEGLTLSVSCDAPWIALQTDTVAADGYIEFYISALQDEAEREALLTVSATDGLRTETQQCRIVQTDDGSNFDVPANQSMRVGYGYDVYGAFQKEVSVMEPVLDPALMTAVNSEDGLMQTSPRSMLDTEYITARSLQEMGKLLTEQEEQTRSGLTGGASKTVGIHRQGDYDGTLEQYAYIRLLKTVAMRSLDVGVLKMNLDRGEKMLNPAFEQARQQIIASPTTKNINNMVDRFGTHIVVQAELGASIELTLNFSRNLRGSLQMRTEDFSDYFFRGATSSYLLTEGKIEGLTSKLSVKDKRCIITGGSAATRKALEQGIERDMRADSLLLEDWLASSSGDFTQDATAAALTPVNFKLLPIWYLFPPKCVGDIIRVINERGERSNTNVSDMQAGTDYYKLELTPQMLSFGNRPEDTQVKVLYARRGSDETMNPVLEICNEYVPAIRGDRRIPVVYGLQDGSPFLGAGFFPGDGEGNPPAWLTFSDGQVYVLPVEGADATTQQTTIYYLHGNIYGENFDIEVEAPARMEVVDQYLEMRQKYPIVKIGEGYWMRQNIREEMYFGEPVNPNSSNSKYRIYEKFDKARDMLYACIYYSNSPQFKHKEWYGNDVHPYFDKRTKWYLPRRMDMQNLQTYVGDNPRILLKGQVSGFEAQYAGVYGSWDDIAGTSFGEYGFHYEGNYCFIPCKDQNTPANGLALILDKDYRLSLSGINATKNNYYPVRLFRTAYWKYPIR